MARGHSRSLRRRTPNRRPRSRLLIVCEGKVTEPKYFKAFRHEHRNQLVEVEVLPDGGVPKTLVEHAVDKKKSAERTARRFADPYLKYDEVWCVFDVDEHPNLPEAKQQAMDNGLDLAISNPCFELWILLHFQDQRAHEHRGQIQRACRNHIVGFVKEVPFDKLTPHYGEATQRAAALDLWQKQQGREGDNPSTAVYKLTERIIALGKQ